MKKISNVLWSKTRKSFGYIHENFKIKRTHVRQNIYELLIKTFEMLIEWEKD